MRRVIWISLLFSGALVGCGSDNTVVGLDGDPGLTGEEGLTGQTGEDGLNCWDLDGDGVADPEEDINGDGVWDALDCQGGSTETSTWTDDVPEAIFIEAGGNSTCVVLGTGEVECWGRDDNALFSQLSSGKYRIIKTLDATSESILYWCGVSEDGEASCFSTDNIVTFDSGLVVDISVSSVAGICALNSDGTVDCTYSDYPPPPELQLQKIDGNIYGHCGIDMADKIVCWGLDDVYGWTNVPTDSFIELDAGSQRTCGIATDGSVKCWGQDSTGEISLFPMEGLALSSLDQSALHGCGVQSDGYAECWGYNKDGASNAPMYPAFKQIATGTSHTCGIHITGSVECWGQDSHGETDVPDYLRL